MELLILTIGIRLAPNRNNIFINIQSKYSINILLCLKVTEKSELKWKMEVNFKMSFFFLFVSVDVRLCIG